MLAKAPELYALAGPGYFVEGVELTEASRPFVVMNDMGTATLVEKRDDMILLIRHEAGQCGRHLFRALLRVVREGRHACPSLKCLP